MPNKSRLNPTEDHLKVGRPTFLTNAAVELDARPEPIFFDRATTAVIVVDMQNAYLSKGGYVDLAGGMEVSPTHATLEQTVKIVEAARLKDVLVVYLTNGWDASYAEAGGSGSPNWHKSKALKTMREQADVDGKLLVKGSWDHALVDALLPGPKDIIVEKIRYSGFFNSTLDSILRARGIRTLVFAGVATNICVESTLRDAYHLEYFCILLEDATSHGGAGYVFDASLYNIETYFGWVSRADTFINALDASGHTADAPTLNAP